MEPLGGTALLEKVHHWGKTLRVYSSAQLRACPLCFVFSIEDVIPELPSPIACCRPSSAVMISSSTPVSAKQTLPFLVALCHDILSQQKVANTALHMYHIPLSQPSLENPSKMHPKVCLTNVLDKLRVTVNITPSIVNPSLNASSC